MKTDVIAVWIFIIYLVVPIVLSYKIAAAVQKQIHSIGVGLSISSALVFGYYLIGLIAWWVFCFTAEIGWSIESLPLAGLILVLISYGIFMVFNIFIMVFRGFKKRIAKI